MLVKAYINPAFLLASLLLGNSGQLSRHMWERFRLILAGDMQRRPSHCLPDFVHGLHRVQTCMTGLH